MGCQGEREIRDGKPILKSSEAHARRQRGPSTRRVGKPRTRGRATACKGLQSAIMPLCQGILGWRQKGNEGNSPCRRPPCAVKVACMVTTGGMERRAVRYRALSLPTAENSHQPTRQRERRMQRFKSPGHAQRLLVAYGPIAQHFRPRRHLCTAPSSRQEMIQRFQIWREITGRATA